MTSMLSTLCCVSLLIFCSVAQTSEPIDGPKAIFRDDLLDNLVGRWDLSRSVRGTQVRNTCEAQWVLNHQFLQVHMKDVHDPPKYEAIVLIGYSHADKRYVIHWMDTYGGKFSSMGTGQRSGDRIEFEFKDDDGNASFFNTFTWDANAGTWTFLMQSADKNGKRALFAEDRLRRQP